MTNLEETFLFELDDGEELNRTCAFCGEIINEMPVPTVEKLDFCDVICAHLYESKNDVKIHPIFSLYKTYYKNNFLSTNARFLYDFLNKLPFDMLPRVGKEMDKNKYISVLQSYVKQM